MSPMVPFVISFSEAMHVDADGGRVEVRACDLCGALVPTQDVVGVDYAKRHVDFHAQLEGKRVVPNQPTIVGP